VGVAALITWIVTALGGFVLLGTWLGRGGMRQREAGASRFPPGLIFGHFLLAAAGLVLWIVYLATDSDALAWVAFVVLLVVAAGGDLLFLRWWKERDRSGAQLAEQTIPSGVVYTHGVFAVATLVLVLLTALGVGD
jgi:hypothetical protein